MALNKRERFLLGTTITLTVLGVNYLLLVPLSRNWKTVRSELTSNRRILEAMKATIQLGPGWRKEYEKLGETLGQRTEQLQQTSEVIRKLQDLGASSGVQMKEVRPTQAGEKEGFREQIVLCNFDSTTETLVKFLFGLQTGSGFMTVEELQVTPQSDNMRILRCTIKIQALTGKSGVSKS